LETVEGGQSLHDETITEGLSPSAHQAAKPRHGTYGQHPIYRISVVNYLHRKFDIDGDVSD